MKKYLTFWILFLLIFLLFIFPSTAYLTDGIPESMNRTTFMEKFWFLSHILSGILIYLIAPFQFSTRMRSKYLVAHRITGRVFILLSLYCILSLFISIIPGSLCDSCRISQYLVTTLWFIFLSGAFVSIVQRKIILHQRLMISGFICAAYFVVVRLIDQTSMSFFNYISTDESQAYLISDIATWSVPLMLIWMYWFSQNSKRRIVKI